MLAGCEALLVCILACLMLMHISAGSVAKDVPVRATLSLDVLYPLPHVWERGVGSGHAALALRADWREHLRLVRDTLGMQAVRFHGLFDDEMGPVVSRAHPEARLEYNFTAIDSIYDYIVSLGMAPYIELSFMPTALANNSHQRYMAYLACTSPPHNLTEWGDLVRVFASHLVQRYGLERVRLWTFEVWNEPNGAPNPVIGGFWRGSQQDYFDLYRVTAQALKGVDKDLRVVGPASAGGGWIMDFLRFCVTNSVPLDGIATHHYPSEVERDSIARCCQNDRATLDRDPVGRHLPLLISEFNSGLLAQDHLLASNHDSSYASAFLASTLPGIAATGDVTLLSYWTFSDVFAEIVWDTVPFHDGYGLVNMQGLPKPSFRAMQLLHELGSMGLQLTQSPQAPVSVSATFDGTNVLVLVTNFQLLAEHNGSRTVEVAVASSALSAQHGKELVGTLRRVDDDHANAHTAWVDMGRPRSLSVLQRAELLNSSQIASEDVSIAGNTSHAWFTVQVPRQGIAAVQISMRNTTAV